MVVKNIILGLGAVGLVGGAFYLYKQVELVSQVGYDFKNFKVDQASANNAVIGFDIVIKNSSSLNLKVYGVFLEVFIDGLKVGEVRNKTLTLLPENSTSAIPLKLSINLSSFGAGITQIITNLKQAKNANLHIEGTMDFGAGILRKTNYEFKYDQNLTSLILQNL